MRTTSLPYIHEFMKRGKRVRFVRRHGKRVLLKLAPDAPGYLAEYQAALARVSSAPAKAQAGAGHLTFDDLVETYLRSAQFTGLKKRTQEENRREAEAIRAKWGKGPTASLESRHVLKWRDELKATPGKANNMLACLKMLLSFGKPYGFKHNNPTAGVKELKGGTHRSWTDQELEKFEARWPVGTRERLIYALALYTGQRKSDLLAMTRTHIDGKWIAVAQQKADDEAKGNRLRIPIHGNLAKAIAAMPVSGLALIARVDGQPLATREMHDVIAAAIDEAGLSDNCVLHGLRKAATRKLAEAGCSAHEIMSITGHKTLAMVQHYATSADQQRLAGSAMLKLWKDRPKRT